MYLCTDENISHLSAAIEYIRRRGASALSLFVLRVLADDADLTLPLYNLALLAHRLYRRSDLHITTPFFKNYTMFRGRISPTKKRPCNIILRRFQILNIYFVLFFIQSDYFSKITCLSR